MDHSVKAMTSHRKVMFSRLLNPRRFENDELERLFQRYIFKLQHVSVASAVVLVSVLAAILAVLTFFYARRFTADGVYLLVHFVCFVCIFVYLNTRWMHDSQILWICYVLVTFLISFAVVYFPTDFGIGHHLITNGQIPVGGNGVWHVVFVVYLLYTLLPLKLGFAMAVGFGLPIAQVLVAFFCATNVFTLLWWQQVICDFSLL